MTRIKLITEELSEVGRFTIPPFQAVPQSITFGNRVFRYHDFSTAPVDHFVYMECFNYTLPLDVLSWEGSDDR